MTKLQVISIIIAAIILVAIFGGSPMESLKKKQQEQSTKRLVAKIMKHNDPDYGKKPKAPPERTNGLDFGGDTSADKVPTDIAPGSTTKPYGTQKYQSGGTPQYQQIQPVQPASSSPVIVDDYYPPTVKPPATQ